MTYTKAQCKKFAHLLRHSKKYLASADDYKPDAIATRSSCTYITDYICFAINKANTVLGNSPDTQQVLRAEIVSRLNGCTTVEYWLMRQKLVTLKGLRTDKTRAKVQAHRHAWVDMLIQEFITAGNPT